MDGKSNAIRGRISSVKNTKKITEAMRLVAAAKVRRAQEAVLSTRPFNEGLQSVFSGLVKRLALENIELPLLQVRLVIGIRQGGGGLLFVSKRWSGPWPWGYPGINPDCGG